MNNIRGTRGGKRDRPSRHYETHNISTSVLALEAGKYYECSELEDRSLTKRLHLRLWGGNRSTLLLRGRPVNDYPDLPREQSRSKRVVYHEDK